MCISNVSTDLLCTWRLVSPSSLLLLLDLHTYVLEGRSGFFKGVDCVFVEIIEVHLRHVMLVKLVILWQFLVPWDLGILDLVEDLDELLAFLHLSFFFLDLLLLLSCQKRRSFLTSFYRSLQLCQLIFVLLDHGFELVKVHVFKVKAL